MASKQINVFTHQNSEVICRVLTTYVARQET